MLSEMGEPEHKLREKGARQVDEVLVEEWERRFEALSPEERALIEAAAGRDRKYGEDSERELAELQRVKPPLQPACAEE